MVTGGAGIVAASIPFLSSLKPSARAQALGAPGEVPVGALEPGEMVRVMWRGRLVFVLRRSEEMISRLSQTTDLLRDPQLQARAFIEPRPHPELGEVPLYGFPTRFSARSSAVPDAPPCFGEHTEYVVRELLRLDDDTIRRYVEAGVFQ